MFSFSNSWQDILINIISDIVFSGLGFIAAMTVIRKINDCRYGRWKITIIKDNVEKISQKAISSNKIKQIRETPEEFPVYIKGLFRGFHNLKCDLDSDFARSNGLLVEDFNARMIIINLDKDLPDDTKSSVSATPL